MPRVERRESSAAVWSFGLVGEVERKGKFSDVQDKMKKTTA